MKLKRRNFKRRSQEEIDSSFNPMNLDYIFKEEDYLSSWLEEREGPLLDGVQNSEWLPIDSDDDEGVVGGENSYSSGTPSQGGNTGLSPPSNNINSNGGANPEQSQGGGEESYFRRDHELLIDMDGGSSRGQSHPRKNSRRENVMVDASSSSSVSQSFCDLDSGASYGSQGNNYPPYYQHPSYMSHDYYPSMPIPPYHQPSMINQEAYHYPSSNVPFYQQMEQSRNTGLYDYVFGGSGYNDSHNENENYDPARHSTMW